MNPVSLVVDVGTSVLKVAIISTNGEMIAQRRMVIEFESNINIPGALIFYPNDLLHKIFKLIVEIQKDERIHQYKIVSILPTCQRLGFVLLDYNGIPICGLPNIDRRAVNEASEISSTIGAAIYKTAGRWPSALHLVSRMMWIRKNEPDLWDKIGKVLSISDWIVYELTGLLISEPTTACETGLFDVNNLDWSNELIDIFSLKINFFPEIVESGTYIERIDSRVAKLLGIDNDVAIIVGGGDTEFGVLGSNANSVSEIAIIAGSSAPIELLLDKPIIDKEFRTILNPGVQKGTWLLESNAMLTGLSWNWLKDILFPDSAEDGYILLDDLVKNACEKFFVSSNLKKEISGAVLGSSIMNSRKGNFPSYSGLMFQFSSFMQKSFNRGQLALVTLESIIYAIRANLEQLIDVSGVTPNVIRVAGGMNRRESFRTLLRATIPYPTTFLSFSDATVLGGAMVALTATGVFKTLNEAGIAMQNRQIQEKLTDQLAYQHLVLEKRYENWLKVFDLFKSDLLN